MLALPLYDDNPRRGVPIVTYGLITACVVVFLWQLGLSPRQAEAVPFEYGMIPAVLFGQAELPEHLQKVPPWATLFTCMFLHGGWLHLIGNMIYLWIFGKGVESAAGPLRFLVFYFVCGAAAGLLQGLIEPDAEVPMIGASGAIAGTLGAYFVLFPRGNVVIFIWFFVFVRLVSVPAVIVLGLWFMIQLLSALSAPAGEPGVAFWAHVGGFITGALLIPIFRRRGVRMLQPARTASFTVARARRPGPWD
jgi:membrane associated rhomboid family serine protease